MTYIVAFCHLWSYVHPEVISAIYVHPIFLILTNTCLGLFTFASGYLLGQKYSFGKGGNSNIWQFYYKRIIRIIPLFVLASVVLYLIGLNGYKATMNGVLCISPFIKPRPKTLWYIPVLLFCYFITPIVSRKNMVWRIGVGLALALAVWLLQKLISSVDWRLSFYLFFYLLGLVTSPYFNWKFEKTPYVKLFTVIVFCVLAIICLWISPTVLYKKVVAGIGVFAVLFVCEFFASLCFKRVSPASIFNRIVLNVSYASMACYMFHRLFFWLGERIFNPDLSWVKWLYMAGLIYPIMLVLSFGIQKGYDSLVGFIKLNNTNKKL